MNSLKKIKMRKVKNLLSSKEEVGKVRASLEQRTEQAFRDFAKSKQWDYCINKLGCGKVLNYMGIEY